MNCSSDLKFAQIFLNHKLFFLTVGQNNFGNKIPFVWVETKTTVLH